MQCPTCPDTSLVTSHCRGIGIRTCPRCGGAWLGGEAYDRLIGRPPAMTSAPVRSAVPRSHLRVIVSDADRNRAVHAGRKKPWLSDISE